MQNYVIEETPTESTAGGVLLYINKKHSYPDLMIYKAKRYESTFIKVTLPKKTNLIVGCIYRHPCMDECTFKDHYLNPSWDKFPEKLIKLLFF